MEKLTLNDKFVHDGHGGLWRPVGSSLTGLPHGPRVLPSSTVSSDQVSTNFGFNSLPSVLNLRRQREKLVDMTDNGTHFSLLQSPLQNYTGNTHNITRLQSKSKTEKVFWETFRQKYSRYPFVHRKRYSLRKPCAHSYNKV